MNPLAESKAVPDNYLNIFQSNLDEIIDVHQKMLQQLEECDKKSFKFLYQVGDVLNDYAM